MSNSICNYAFRINADGLTPETLKTHLNTLCKAWVFQKEQGEQSGYLHYQGRFSLKTKARKNELLSRYAAHGFPAPNYLEPELASGAAAFYSTKIETRLEGPWSDKDVVRFIPDYIQEFNTLLPWQQYILSQHTVRNLRKIHWVYDERGNHGKSIIATHMRLYHNAVVLPPVNDSKELLQACCCLLRDRNNRTPGSIFLDLPRCLTKEKLHGFLTAAEQIKTGYVIDMRNHTQEWDFNPPQVWIFSNTQVPTSDLSNDRWITWSFDTHGRFISSEGTTIEP